MSDATGTTYDVFISYSHTDGVWVQEQLLPCLEGAHLRVCIDTRDFEFGTNSLVNMERAVDTSRHVLLVLTPAWVTSEWAEFESLLAGAQDPAARRRKIIPLMLQTSTLPPRLAMLTWADLRNPTQQAAQLQRLVSQLQRLKGETPPSTQAPSTRPTAVDAPITPQGQAPLVDPAAQLVTVINTGGGTYIAGNVNAEGDFVGRDRIDNAATTSLAAESTQQGSWQRQLANYHDSLRLIEERMADYVLASEIPLQLVREKERLLAKIAEVEQKLGNL